MVTLRNVVVVVGGDDEGTREGRREGGRRSTAKARRMDYVSVGLGYVGIPEHSQNISVINNRYFERS